MNVQGPSQPNKASEPQQGQVNRKRNSSEERTTEVGEEILGPPREKSRRSGVITREESARLMPHAIARGASLGFRGALPSLSENEKMVRDHFLEALQNDDLSGMNEALSSVTDRVAFHLFSMEGIESVPDPVLDQLIARFRGDVLGAARTLANTGVFRPVLARMIQKVPEADQKSLMRHVANLLVRAAATTIAEEFFSFLPSTLRPDPHEFHQMEQDIEGLAGRLSGIHLSFGPQ